MSSTHERFEFGDRRYTLDEICAEKGIRAGRGVTAKIVSNRLTRGKGLTEAITQPKGKPRTSNAKWRSFKL